VNDSHPAARLAYDLWESSPQTYYAEGAFKAYVDDLSQKLVLMATVPSVGRKNTMTVRCVKMIPLATVENEIVMTLEALGREVRAAAERSSAIGVRF